MLAICEVFFFPTIKTTSKKERKENIKDEKKNKKKKRHSGKKKTKLMEKNIYMSINKSITI